MKKTSSASGCSRSKPPPVRNYLNAKSRPLGAPFLSPTHHASDRRVSMSEKAEGVESIAALRNSPKEVTDCMSSWLSFMQMLRGVCTSGAQLSGTLGQLACQSSACRQRASQLQLMWQQLSQATAAATALVQRHTVAALQEVQLVQPPGEVDADQADINQQVVCSGLLTMINLQYQLSAACCECLSQLAECRCFPPHLSATADCNDAVARCFAAKLQPLQPLQPPQRRWSEAAAAAEGGGESEAAALRRWSMPWKLALPTTGAERSRSTTPETVWHTALASQEELQDVISLLAAKPPPPGGPSTHNLPGVTLTKATGGGPCIGGAVSDSFHGSEAIPRPSFSFSHRGSWWGGGTDGDELDIGTLASRKSSSSTDSSSCYSIHSRSSGSASEELTHGQRSHLYSMWSGSDLPFIKLPESSENTES